MRNINNIDLPLAPGTLSIVYHAIQEKEKTSGKAEVLEYCVFNRCLEVIPSEARNLWPYALFGKQSIIYDSES